jgi:tRNA pseudouridine55 synthase
MDTIVADMPGLRLNPDLSVFVRRGEAVFVPQAPTSGWVRLYGSQAAFMGLGEVLDDGRIAPRRLVKEL